MIRMKVLSSHWPPGIAMDARAFCGLVTACQAQKKRPAEAGRLSGAT
jgi:hypothetical protein